MIPFEEALQIVLEGARFLGAEEVPLDRAFGRFLAKELVSRWDLPPYDNSAMDGYALRAEDTGSASTDRPVRLALSARAYAGSATRIPVRPGQCGYITTGAAIPAGADAVVRQEDVLLEGENLSVSHPVKPGQNIRRQGEDTPSGRVLLETGTRVDPGAIALLATFGFTRVSVGKRPRVAILSTGDELCDVAQARPGAIVDSNGHMAQAMATDAGAEASRMGIVRDEESEMVARLLAAAELHDVVVTLGGSSVGERDVVARAMRAIGVDIRFWNVAMKPGRPVGFGIQHGRMFFALPGNPGAASTTFELLVRPALLMLQGASTPLPRRLRARLDAHLYKQPGITAFLRARVSMGHGLSAHVAEWQGKRQLTGALETNGFAILPPERSEVSAGEVVDVLIRGGPPPVKGPPVVCFVGPSGVGKTTLLEKIIARLSARGLCIGAVKHDAHAFQMDREGKDTFRFREAGANSVAIASESARAVIATTDRPTSLTELIGTLPLWIDLVLVEGYKGDDAPKIEMHRRGRPLLHPQLTSVIALVTDDEQANAMIPRFGYDDVDALCELLLGLP